MQDPEKFMDINYYLNEMIINDICLKQVKHENNPPEHIDPKNKEDQIGTGDLERIK